MLYLIAAIIGSSSLVVILKVFGLKGVDLNGGITVNYIIASLLAFAFAPHVPAVGEMVRSEWFIMALVIGAMFMLSFVVYALSAQKSGVAVTTISGRAAVIIPVLFAFRFLGEEPTVTKIGLLALILLSMFLILRKRSGSGSEGGPKLSQAALLLLPVGVFLFNGINDTLVQYTQRTKIPAEDLYPVFNGIMFAAGAATGLFCFITGNIRKHHRPTWRDLGWGSLLGVMNWICMTGVFYGLGYLDGSIFYPLYYTGAIVLATVAGIWLFQEKLTRVNYAGIILAVAAIAALSML